MFRRLIVRVKREGWTRFRADCLPITPKCSLKQPQTGLMLMRSFFMFAMTRIIHKLIKNDDDGNNGWGYRADARPLGLALEEQTLCKRKRWATSLPRNAANRLNCTVKQLDDLKFSEFAKSVAICWPIARTPFLSKHCLRSLRSAKLVAKPFGIWIFQVILMRTHCLKPLQTELANSRLEEPTIRRFKNSKLRNEAPLPDHNLPRNPSESFFQIRSAWLRLGPTLLIIVWNLGKSNPADIFLLQILDAKLRFKYLSTRLGYSIGEYRKSLNSNFWRKRRRRKRSRKTNLIRNGWRTTHTRPSRWRSTKINPFQHKASILIAATSWDSSSEEPCSVLALKKSIVRVALANRWPIWTQKSCPEIWRID